MSKHTVGPWTLVEQHGSFQLIEPSISWSRSHSTDDIRNQEIRRSETGLREMADANLIAASPEMLEALKYWLPDETMIPAGHEEAWQKAVAAIAKAEGRQ